MGGKSRKTGSVSKKLIDRLKAGKIPATKKPAPSDNKKRVNPFGLS